MEIKDKLTVSGGEQGGGQQWKEGEGPSRNMYKEPMDKDNGGGD